MKYIELFAGVGGFRLGIERAFSNAAGGRQGENGRETLEHNEDSANTTVRPRKQVPTCAFANEWDKYAAQTYNKNFGGEIDTRDITTIGTNEIPDHDLLVGGFPCQAFSVAGKRKGFDETRGTLFFEIARILADKKPQHLLLENVKGLLSHDSGRTFQTILRVLADLGYRVEWQVLNSKDFGVPQNRERVFIIGHLGACCGRQVFPIGNDDQVFTQRQRQISPTVTSRYYKQGQSDPYITEQLVDTKEWNQPNTNNANGRKPYPKIRRLTPVECERLQGFPDGWTEGVSDTQRYKQMGNAVTVNVVEAVVAALSPQKRTKPAKGTDAKSAELKQEDN